MLFVDNYFFAQLPGTSADPNRLPGTEDYALVAYDADGHEVARESIADAHKPFEFH